MKGENSVKKIAIMLVMSVVFVSVLQGVSSANLFVPVNPIASGAMSTTETYVPLPGGGHQKTTETTIEPSTKGGIYGAAAGAATGAVIGSFIPVVGTAVGAGLGAVWGGIAGWIFGPAD